MIPDSIATLVGFLLLLAPGIVWELLRARHVPSVKETTLIEVCRVVLVSLVATVLAGLALLWMWLPASRALSPSDTPTVDDQVTLVGMVLITATLACGLVTLLAYIRWRGDAQISTGRVWHRAFVEWRQFPSSSHQRGQVTRPPLLTVELQDGTVWKGEYGAADSDPEDGNRTLALQAPLSRRRPDEERFSVKDTAGVVLLPEREIRSVQVTYSTATRES